MSKIFGSILETIGGTPLVEVKGFDEGGARVLAKVEYFNPGGSVKDRIALSMIDRPRLPSGADHARHHEH